MLKSTSSKEDEDDETGCYDDGQDNGVSSLAHIDLHNQVVQKGEFVCGDSGGDGGCGDSGGDGGCGDSGGDGGCGNGGGCRDGGGDGSCGNGGGCGDGGGDGGGCGDGGCDGSCGNDGGCGNGGGDGDGGGCSDGRRGFQVIMVLGFEMVLVRGEFEVMIV